MNHLNLYLRPHQPPTYWAWGASSVLLVMGIWLAVLAFEQHEGVARAMQRNEKLRVIKAANAPMTPGRAEQDEQKRWAQLDAERNFPWALVFQAVERTGNNEIELLEFRPDKLNRAIALRGEAKDRKALIAYLAALAKQPGMTKAHLTHEQTVARGTLVTVSFEIKATLVNSVAPK